MQQPQRRSRLILGLMALGLLAGAALTVPPAQAQVAGPYYANPAWDRKMVPANRFVVLTNWNSEAVLDKETGLVWEKSPQTTFFTWSDALNMCLDKTVGGRLGWRLPSIPELASLIDPSVAAPGPTLPAGHPFTIATGDPGDGYWSATTDAGDPTGAWGVGFFSGFLFIGDKSFTGGGHAWCVRGGMNADQY